MTEDKFPTWLMLCAVTVPLLFGFALGLTVGSQDIHEVKRELRSWRTEAVKRGYAEKWRGKSSRDAVYRWKEE